MAILFDQVNSAGRRLQIRSAGRSRRLYIDGVLHSHHHPTRAFGGDIWDALALASLGAASGQPQRILMLGLGGGSVVHLLRKHLLPQAIVAIELEPSILELAQSYFAIEAGGDLALYQAEAQSWLEDYGGPPFDVVIEDLFLERDGVPQRAVACDTRWLHALDRRLEANAGALVLNFSTLDELKNSALVLPATRRRFKSALCLASPVSGNGIAVLTHTPINAPGLRSRINALPAMSKASTRRELRLHIKTLW